MVAVRVCSERKRVNSEARVIPLLNESEPEGREKVCEKKALKQSQGRSRGSMSKTEEGNV